MSDVKVKVPPPPINKHFRVTIMDANELEGIQSDLGPPIPSWFWHMVEALRQSGYTVRVQEQLLVDVSENIVGLQ